MTGTGSAAEHLAPGLFDIVGTRLGGRETFYSQLYNVHTSKRNYEDWLAATGLPIAVEKPQSADIQTGDPVEGSTKRLTHKVYAIGFEVTEEAWDDDLYSSDGSMLRDAGNGLADSLAERVELEAHRPFNAEGFDGSTFTVLPDSSGFFATSHSPITGGQGIAQANRPTTETDLTVTAFQDALVTFRRYRNDQNYRIPGVTDPKLLLVPPEYEFVAQEILRSDNRPDTGNRVINTVKGRTSIMINPYLDDTDAWMIMGSKHFNVFLWRWRPRMDSYDDRRARVAVHVAYQRFSYAPIHWLGWYGTTGI